MRIHGGVVAAIVAGSLAATPKAAGAGPAKLRVDSAFRAGAEIPTEYTCDGANTPPPLSWSAVPNGTKSIAVLVDDPDAPKGTFTHWLVAGLPATATSLGDKLPDGAFAAKNDKGDAGYTGPCPPTGKHRYRFQVFALDDNVRSVSSRTAFLRAINGHVLAQGELDAVYERHH